MQLTENENMARLTMNHSESTTSNLKKHVEHFTKKLQEEFPGYSLFVEIFDEKTFTVAKHFSFGPESKKEVKQ